jgi:hypothetical protein
MQTGVVHLHADAGDKSGRQEQVFLTGASFPSM